MTASYRRAIAPGLLLVVAAGIAAEAGIVYSAYRDDAWGVYYQAELDSPPRRVGPAVGDGNAPRLSPDGHSVAFEVQGAGIKVCTLQSDCRSVPAPEGTPGRPGWHPLTSELVFANHRVDGSGEDSDIFATGGGLSRVDALVRQTGNQDHPRISPDGRQLVYSSGQTVGLRKAGVDVIQQLWLMGLDSGIARQLTTGSWQDIHPEWSPSGKAIAFASNRSGQFEIWVTTIEMDAPRQLTSSEGAKTWPSWSPDGKSLLFTMTRDGIQELWLVNADGTNPRPFRPFGPQTTVQVRDGDWQ